MMKKVFALFLFTFLLLTPSVVQAQNNISYPQVQSLNPTRVKPADTVLLTGINFGREGQLTCNHVYNPQTQQYDAVNFLFTYKTVLGMYKIPKQPTSGTPDYRLEIISIEPTSITARVPQDVALGEYLVGYNAEAPKNLCAGYGDILVGFGKYDKIEVIQGQTVVHPTDIPTIPVTVPTSTSSVPNSVISTTKPTHLPTKPAVPTTQPITTTPSVLSPPSDEELFPSEYVESRPQPEELAENVKIQTQETNTILSLVRNVIQQLFSLFSAEYNR